MKAIVLLGLPCAGKSTAMSCFGSEYVKCETGDIVREMFDEESDKERESINISEWSTMKREEDNAYATREAIDRVVRNKKDKYIFSGLRCKEELQLVQEEFNETTFIFINTSFEERYERFSSRGRRGENKKEKLEHRDKEEKDWGMREIINEELYDICIDGDCSKKELCDKIKNQISH
jgi:dephospho-CoA kinase